MPDEEQETLEALREQLVHGLNEVFDELGRLREESRRLRDENKDLREELTLLRLYHEGDMPDDLNGNQHTAPMPLPEAAAFFRKLPRSLNFAFYFRKADEEGIESEAAKAYLLHFIQEGLLVQKGHRLEKAEGAVQFFRTR